MLNIQYCMSLADNSFVPSPSVQFRHVYREGKEKEREPILNVTETYLKQLSILEQKLLDFIYN